MAIILLETYFHAPSAKGVREFLYKHNIQWFIDIPHNTFRPHNNAKCVILIIQKGLEQQEFINMAVAEFVGHDHNGRVIYNPDGSVKDDTINILNEVKNNPKDSKYVFKIESQRVIGNDILIPRYYWKNKELQLLDMAKEKQVSLVGLRNLIDDKCISFFDGHGSAKGELKGEVEIPYIRVKDIVNWQIYKGSYR